MLLFQKIITILKTNEILFVFASTCVRYLDTIILAITFTRMTPNSTFHLSVRILWNH